MREILRRAPRLLLGIALSLGPATAAWAVYKLVGPNGSVTFTDVPPSSGDASSLPGTAPSATSPSGDSGALPAKLRTLQQRAPVIVYTAPDCKACSDGIQLLRQRGIPYRAKTVASPQDAQAFKALDPDLRVPLLSVAGVRLTPGFNADAWNQALDAAGYPAHSELPKGYRFPVPAPLVAIPAVLPGTPGASAPGSTAQPSVAPPPNPNAPPGFKF